MQNLRIVKNIHVCKCVHVTDTHLLTYAKFAQMQKLENLPLAETTCTSHFMCMQILHIGKSVHGNGKQKIVCIGIYVFMLYKC